MERSDQPGTAPPATVPAGTVTPGRATALVGPRVVVLTAVTAADPTVSSLTGLVLDGADIDSVIDALDESADSVRDLPDLVAIGAIDGDPIVIVRGLGAVWVEGPRGVRRIDSRGRRRWRETQVPTASSVVLGFTQDDRSAPPADDAGGYPLGFGIVAAARIRLEPAPFAGIDSSPEPDRRTGAEPTAEAAAEPRIEAGSDAPSEPVSYGGGSPAPSRIIDEVPGFAPAAPAPSVPEPAPSAPSAPLDPAGPEPAPSAPLDPAGPEPTTSVPEPTTSVPEAPVVSDDGLEDLTVAREVLRARAMSEPAESIGDGSKVTAVICDRNHANPPHQDRCRVCGIEIRDRSMFIIHRPPLGVLRFEDGREEVLDAALVIGRDPAPGLITDGRPVRTVVVPSPDSSISRTHAVVRIEGWQVQVVDRDSTNDTFVTVPGQPEFQLRPGEPFPIPPGTSVRLGDDVVFRFEIPT